LVLLLCLVSPSVWDSCTVHLASYVMYDVGECRMPKKRGNRCGITVSSFPAGSDETTSSIFYFSGTVVVWDQGSEARGNANSLRSTKKKDRRYDSSPPQVEVKK
jgi:hypothetical protein